MIVIMIIIDTHEEMIHMHMNSSSVILGSLL